MPHTLIIEEQVDIYKLPTVSEEQRAKKGIEITIGDLHANAMKLMFLLVKHGIATDLTEANYDRLAEIYNTSVEELTKDILTEFNQILDTVTFRSEALVRLIGDELSDRGSNDYFVLKILEKLHIHKIPVEILISNHSIGFVEAYEKQRDFRSPMLMLEHAESLFALNALVSQQNESKDRKGNIIVPARDVRVKREEIIDIVYNAYKSMLKAVSYSVSDDKQAITIYSHAPIGLHAIQVLADKLEVVYDDSTIDALVRTIDSINSVFQTHVGNNTVHTLYSSAEMARAYRWEGASADLSNSPLEFILWNRRLDLIKRPEQQAGYRVYFVHGHDDEKTYDSHIYNLDNRLGKLINYNKGMYTVLLSRSDSMTYKQTVAAAGEPALTPVTPVTPVNMAQTEDVLSPPSSNPSPGMSIQPITAPVGGPIGRLPPVVSLSPKVNKDNSRQLAVLNRYYPYGDKPRFHLFKAKSSSSGITPRGDQLKALILLQFMQMLHDSESVPQAISNFKDSESFAILSKGQGLVTWLLFNMLGCKWFKPTSLKAFDNICKESVTQAVI